MNWLTHGEVRLQGYTDYYWEGSAVDIFNTLGCCFSFGFVTISRKQVFVALGTVEIVYIGDGIVSCKAVWLQKIIPRLHLRHDAEGSYDALVHIHR